MSLAGVSRHHSSVQSDGFHKGLDWQRRCGDECRCGPSVSEISQSHFDFMLTNYILRKQTNLKRTLPTRAIGRPSLTELHLRYRDRLHYFRQRGMGGMLWRSCRSAPSRPAARIRQKKQKSYRETAE